MARLLEGVFEIAPLFIAESSHSIRHLTEFSGLDIVFAGCFEVNEIMQLEEEILKY